MSLFLRDKEAIGKRLIQLQKDLKIKSSRQLALSIDMDPSYLGKVQKGETSISDKYVEGLQKEYQVNPEWLLFGKGEKFGINVPHKTLGDNQELGDLQAPYQKRRNNLKTGKVKNLTPVYNIRASAGEAILFQRPELVVDYVDIPFIGKADGVIEIVGDSMLPTYVNGTRIAVRKLEDKQLFYPNECYFIIDSNYDARVKRLLKSDKKDHIILHSDNKAYPNVELHWDKILAVHKILCRIIKN